MNKVIPLSLMVAGIVLIIYGIKASNSTGYDLSGFFTGLPTDKTIWLLCGGLMTAALGAGRLLSRAKSL